jgi:hypothetical protein
MSDPKPVQPQENIEPYVSFEKRDENQIVKEMQGETTLIEEYVYSFKQGNRTITSLSYAGVKEMVRRRGNFKILDVQTEETDKTIRARVIIRDLNNNVEFIGASETEKEKAFAYVLTLNKAERNAFMKAMPVKLLADMVNNFLHSATPQPAPQAPPNSTPKTQENPQKIPQATFLTPDQIYAEFPPELAELLDFKEEEDVMILKPREFLKEAFKDVAAVVKGIGGEYISAGRDSHFKVRLR